MTANKITVYMSLLFFAAVMSMASTASAQPANPAPATVPVVDGGAPAADAAAPAADATPEEKALEAIEKGTAEVDKNPDKVVSDMVAAFKEGRWAAGIGLLLTILIWFTRRFIWQFVPKKALPWLTFGLAMVITVSVELVAGIVWWKTLIDGFLTCGSAMAFWTLVLKKVAGDKPSES